MSKDIKKHKTNRMGASGGTPFNPTGFYLTFTQLHPTTMNLEIMDTTLRDGEQTSGVSYNKTEKLNIARVLLEEVKADRLEIASARVSQGEMEGAKAITRWARQANRLEQVEILGFIDGTASLEWIRQAGGQVINLLCKGSEAHVRGQLRQSPQEHIDKIRGLVAEARSMGISVNVYLEDWSNGMRHSPDYVDYFIRSLKEEPILRFMLPDTLGILNPEEVGRYIHSLCEAYPNLHFDFHPHNDYGLAEANVLAAATAGASGIHTTVNGLGERAGNVPLASVVGIINDHQNKVQLGIEESSLAKISKLVESFSGIRIPSNMPVVGENVFTQTSGIHADGDQKNNLYYNDLMPERFGRKRQYALGKMSGKASIQKNLEELGIELDGETMKKLTQKVIALGDRKDFITKEDLPYIIADLLQSSQIDDKIKVKNYSLSVAEGLRSVATLRLGINGDEYEATASGDGQYDAFMKALYKIYDDLGKQYPALQDYLVTIPPGGRTDALVETVITWCNEGHSFRTRGLDPDQTVAAIKATVKMLNLQENGGIPG